MPTRSASAIASSATATRCCCSPGAPGLRLQCAAQVAGLLAHPRQWLQPEAPRDQLEDRARVVARVVNESALHLRADDDRRDARAGPEPVAPAGAGGRGAAGPVPPPLL